MRSLNNNITGAFLSSIISCKKIMLFGLTFLLIWQLSIFESFFFFFVAQMWCYSQAMQIQNLLQVCFTIIIIVREKDKNNDLIILQKVCS